MVIEWFATEHGLEVVGATSALGLEVDLPTGVGAEVAMGVAAPACERFVVALLGQVRQPHPGDRPDRLGEGATGVDQGVVDIEQDAVDQGAGGERIGEWGASTGHGPDCSGGDGGRSCGER